MSDAKQSGSEGASVAGSGKAGSTGGKSKGTMLKVMSWIFVILGCLFTLLWILAKAKAAAMGSMNNLMPAGGAVNFVTFIALIAFILQIPAGICGLKNSIKPAKTMGIIILVISVITMIGSFFTPGFVQIFSGILMLVIATLFMCGIAEIEK